MIIVYKSYTGFSKRCAELISSGTGLPALELKAALKSDDRNIIYVASLRAERVAKLKKAFRKFNVKAVVSVGLTVGGEGFASHLKELNRVDAPFFYVQGGYNPNAVRGFSKLIMNGIAKSIAKSIKRGETLEPTDRAFYDILTNGLDALTKESVEAVNKYIIREFDLPTAL